MQFLEALQTFISRQASAQSETEDGKKEVAPLLFSQTFKVSGDKQNYFNRANRFLNQRKVLKMSARVLCLETCTFLIQVSQITLDRLRLPKAPPQNLLLNSKNEEPDEDSYLLTEPSSSQQN